MDISIGSLVYSRAGRDKGKLFFVTAVGDGYVYLADGDARRISKPKKKKLKHINKTNTVLKPDSGISDSAVRKALAEFEKTVCDIVGR